MPGVAPTVSVSNADARSEPGRAEPRATLHGPQTIATSCSRMALPAALRAQACGVWSHCKSSVDPQSLQNGCKRRALADNRFHAASYPRACAVNAWPSPCGRSRALSLCSSQRSASVISPHSMHVRIVIATAQDQTVCSARGTNARHRCRTRQRRMRLLPHSVAKAPAEPTSQRQ